MIVADLEELLAMCPDDLGIVIATHDLGAWHIDELDKQPRRRIKDWPDRALPKPLVEIDGRHPAHLVLRASCNSPRWWQAFGDQVDYRLGGRWPDAAYSDEPGSDRR